jgi:hypothetical protein
MGIKETWYVILFKEENKFLEVNRNDTLLQKSQCKLVSMIKDATKFGSLTRAVEVAKSLGHPNVYVVNLKDVNDVADNSLQVPQYFIDIVKNGTWIWSWNYWAKNL